MKNITIKHIDIGKGVPKVIVPIVGSTPDALFDEIKTLPKGHFDLIEWRADHLDHLTDIDGVVNLAAQLRGHITTTPLLFTCRSQHEGGKQAFSDNVYHDLNHALINSGTIDLIDIEMSNGQDQVSSMVEQAHKKGIAVIVSYHNQKKTPPKEDIVKCFSCMQATGADIIKIAVTPASEHDLLCLYSAVADIRRLYPSQLMVMIAMGELGKITRLACPLFGSCLTFCAGKDASAPGQISAEMAYPIISLLYNH